MLPKVQKSQITKVAHETDFKSRGGSRIFRGGVHKNEKISARKARAKFFNLKILQKAQYFNSANSVSFGTIAQIVYTVKASRESTKSVLTFAREECLSNRAARSVYNSAKPLPERC